MGYDHGILPDYQSFEKTMCLMREVVDPGWVEMMFRSCHDVGSLRSVGSWIYEGVGRLGAEPIGHGKALASEIGLARYLLEIFVRNVLRPIEFVAYIHEGMGSVVVEAACWVCVSCDEIVRGMEYDILRSECGPWICTIRIDAVRWGHAVD